MSSSKSLKMREPVDGKSVPMQTSPISSLVSYSYDTGSDDESSISKTASQDYHVNLNHSENLDDVCNKSNSKESCESLISTSSDKINYPGCSLNSHRKESVLKSRENEQNESSVIPLTESPKNGDGNVLKTFVTPTSIRKTEMFRKSSTSLERSFSVIENDNDGEKASFTPKTSIKRIQGNSNSWPSPNRRSFSRKSLPAETDSHSSPRNVLKTIVTPTSDRKTEVFRKSSTPLKRSFSVIESDNDEESASFTPKRSIKRIEQNSNSWPSPNRHSFSRKSLPAETDSHSSCNDTYDRKLQNRRSYPFSRSPFHSPTPKRNFSSYRTDQTPYSPARNDRGQQKRRRFNLPDYDAFGLMSLESESGFIDSHCHLDFIFLRQNYEGTYAEFQKENENTFPKSYRGCLAIFCNPFTFSKKDVWGKFLKEENVWASFGCHPHNAKDYNDDIEESLYAALEHSKVRALGEIGLDYSNRNNCMKTVQFKAFRRQLKIALEKQLPVVIHCREAHEDAMGIIKEVLPINYTIHLHCFTDTWEWAQKWLNEFPKLCIGITNVVTFPSAESVHEVAKNIPLDRLLLETDAPYFIPKRGCHQGMRWSHPGLAIHVAAQIAALKSINIEEVLQSTRNNTKRVYKI